MSDGALAGLKVVDLTRVLAGPFCTMLLGDLGADVVKVERPGRGDDTREWGPPFSGGESAYYLGLNRNKRSVTLDLKSESGREVLRRLFLRSDVVVDNFKLGTLESWGFDDGWFEEHSPRAVRCTISGYGSTGPMAGKPGYDFIAQAESGLMAITGQPEGEPMKLGVAIVDFCVGLMAAIAILAALEARRRTGSGQKTGVNLHDTGLQMLGAVASNHLISGEPAVRYGNDHPNIVPYRTFQTADGTVAIGVGNDGQFRTFAGIIGCPEWADDPRFSRNRDRVRNRSLIDALIQEQISRHPTDHWTRELGKAGIPNGPVKSVPDEMASPHAKARNMVVDVDHPTIGIFRSVGIPFRFSSTPAIIRAHPPLLGEHTEEILAEIGYSAESIAQLRSNDLT